MGSFTKEFGSERSDFSRWDLSQESLLIIYTNTWTEIVNSNSVLLGQCCYMWTWVSYLRDPVCVHVCSGWFPCCHSVVVCGHRSPTLVTLFVCMYVPACVAGVLGHSVVSGNGSPTLVALFVCVCVSAGVLGHSAVVCGNKSPTLVTLFVCVCVSAGVARVLPGHGAAGCGLWSDGGHHLCPSHCHHAPPAVSHLGCFASLSV